MLDYPYQQPTLNSQYLPMQSATGTYRPQNALANMMQPFPTQGMQGMQNMNQNALAYGNPFLQRAYAMPYQQNFGGGLGNDMLYPGAQDNNEVTIQPYPYTGKQQFGNRPPFAGGPMQRTGPGMPGAVWDFLQSKMQARRNVPTTANENSVIGRFNAMQPSEY